MNNQKPLTHIAGTFVIQADGAFLNGAGLGQGEDRTTTVPKTFKDGKYTVPYVSAQSWRRWLRNTLIEETGWPASELRAIGANERGNTNKIASELNPIDYAEDDLFGYMRASGKDSVAEQEEGDEGDQDNGDEARPGKNTRVKPLMRPSPFSTSILAAIRRDGKMNRDEGFVHLTQGTPQPYATQFYFANLQAVFCLDYSRLGVFRNVGDRIELREDLIQTALKNRVISVIEDLKDKGKVYAISDATKSKDRAQALLKALAVLRGGAKQAQFASDVTPKVMIAAGLSCGNPIFNKLFEDDADHGLRLKMEALKEIALEFADRLTTPVYIGIRTGLFANEEQVRMLSEFKDKGVSFVLCTPREAIGKLVEHLE
jgi:CRISPR-associated protein Cst2